MTGAACMLLYGAALAWLGPGSLDRITRSGVSPRLSVAVWLSAIAVVAVVWVVAGAGLILDVVLLHSAADPVRYCMDVLLAVHRFGWFGDAVLIAVAAAGASATTLAARRIMAAMHRMSARSCEHASTAHMLGARDGVVVVTSEHRAAYCVAGRPSAIVVTSGAVSSLDAAELEAVLAHERAHLRGRHPQLLMLLNALYGVLPWVPLLRRAADAVARLVEMCADDAAARSHGSAALLRGLVALTGAPSAPGGALAAGDTAMVARAWRLADPAPAGTRWRRQVVLSLTLVTVIVTPVAMLLMPHP